MTRISFFTFPIFTLPLPGAAAADPTVGTTLTIPVASVAVSADGSGREAKRVVYAPPPGWYVRSHRVVVTRKEGAVSYAVNTVPAGWAWRAEEQAAMEARGSGSATVTAYKVSAGGQAAGSHGSAASESQATASSHHVLIVEAVARGPGLWRGASEIELTVVADLVYLGR